MDVVIAGGHGKIALRLTRLLADADHRVRGIIRNADHADDLREAGAEPLTFDLEAQSSAELAEAIAGADAFVFAAGAGPGSGDARKETVDKGGAVKGVEACEQAGVERYVIVSSMGAEDPSSGGEGMSVYLKAKADADEAVIASSLDWTVVRPGHLTDEDGTGSVTVSTGDLPGADVTRQDVAAVIAACLTTPSTVGVTFQLREGDVAIDDALASLS